MRIVPLAAGALALSFASLASAHEFTVRISLADYDLTAPAGVAALP